MVLGQRLDLASWLAIAVIVTANTVAVGFAARHPREATAGRAGQERAAQAADSPPPDPVSDPGAGPLRTEAAERHTRHPADCLT